MVSPLIFQDDVRALAILHIVIIQLTTNLQAKKQKIPKFEPAGLTEPTRPSYVSATALLIEAGNRCYLSNSAIISTCSKSKIMVDVGCARLPDFLSHPTRMDIRSGRQTRHGRGTSIHPASKPSAWRAEGVPTLAFFPSIDDGRLERTSNHIHPASRLFSRHHGELQGIADRPLR